KQLHRVMSNGIDSSFGGEDFHYVAYFNLPPDTIDVNVHPNKTIIKCMEISKMISLLTSTIRELGIKKPSKEGHENLLRDQISPSFFEGLNSSPSLQQERHDYNMEGLFSPHNLPGIQEEDLIWIGPSFLKKT